MPPQPTTSGIITDEASGERHIPASTRADGSTRKAIKIRPGYKPPEDIEKYKNRTAESFRQRYKGGVVGAEAAAADGAADSAAKPAASVPGAAAASSTASAAANKNAKRREARKKAAAASAAAEPTPNPSKDAQAAPQATPAADPAADREKKARGLKKKLKQAKELQSKRDGGEALLPEQIAKVIRINELVRELDALGFGTDGEPKPAGTEADKADKPDKPDKPVTEV